MQTGDVRRPFPWGRVLLGIAATLIGVVVAIGFWLHSQFHPAGYDALIDAVQKKDTVAARRVLDSGVSPNVCPNSALALFVGGDSPALPIAVQRNDLAMVKLLVERGADPNKTGGWGESPLSTAASEPGLPIMKCLLDHKAKVNDQPGGSSILWRVAMEGNREAVALLLAHGANPNTAQPDRPDYRLMHALRTVEGSEPIIKMLRAAGGKD